jgi:hypothetical protein
MPKLLSRAIQAAGLYRLSEVIFSLWTGKSLLAIAVISLVAPMISASANGFDWGSLDKYLLIAASIYAALAVGWLASIKSYREISPHNKLSLVGFDFGATPVPGSNPITALAFDAKILFANVGSFPISYLITELDFRVHNTTVSNSTPQNRQSQVDVGQTSTYYSEIITFHHPITLPVEGRLTVKWSYGKFGRERFHRTVYLLVSFAPDSSSPSGIRHQWRYAESK